jgi:hypothetical protein
MPLAMPGGIRAAVLRAVPLARHVPLLSARVRRARYFS